MPYYDRWNDRNREAHRLGERDAERGYEAHRRDYDMMTESRAAYEDGYREAERVRERREGDRARRSARSENQPRNRVASAPADRAPCGCRARATGGGRKRPPE